MAITCRLPTAASVPGGAALLLSGSPKVVIPRGVLLTAQVEAKPEAKATAGRRP